LLADLLGRVAGCFPRRETRQSCGQMLHGLLMELDDHNCWTIAEAAGHRGPHQLQHLLSRAVWDDQQVLDIASVWAVSHLDDGDAVLIIDETADKKSSADCAGAARQYSGTVGDVALCQVAVTLTFATSRGHALIGRALYLPEGCAADEEHRELAGVPQEVMFATKPQLAGDLLDRAHGLGIRAAFVAGDEVSCRLSAVGIRFPGLPAPAGGFRLPHGRPTGRDPAGPHRGCHVPHAIDTAGEGVL
jgi:SRSO17 transposase